MGMKPDPTVADVLPGPLVSNNTVTTNSSECNNSSVYIEINKTIDSGDDINTESVFCKGLCLISAVKHGCIKDIEFLILHKADLNVNYQGMTALRYAIEYDTDISIVKLLLEKGADPNVKDNIFKETALISALSKGQMEVAKLLIEKGADPNVIDENNGKTVLMLAVTTGQMEVAKLLLEKGADPNVRGGNGKTALWWAEYHHDECLIKLLTEKGRVRLRNVVIDLIIPVIHTQYLCISTE